MKEKVKKQKAEEKKQEAEKQNSKIGAVNVMRSIKIEKVLLSGGATAENLAKEKRLIEIISGEKAKVSVSRKRIPTLGVRPGLEVGVFVTIRGKKAFDMLKRLLGAVDNTIKEKQISENHFSFGIKEYIEIPGMEYQRDVGIRGLNATVDFARPGLRVKRRKIKASSVPAKQHIPREEIIKFMQEAFKTKFV